LAFVSQKLCPEFLRPWVRAGAAVIAAWCCGAAAQPVAIEAATPGSVVRGLHNWVHSTGDAERSFAFYHDVFGIELAPSPFAGGRAAPEGIRPVAEAGSDALVWDLTNTHGSRFRTVFMRAPNTAFGLELSEFFDVPRSERPANAWDPGASRFIFDVRDLAAVVARLRDRAVPVVTLGGVPIDVGGAAALLVRDPDGYLVEVRQASRAAIAAATGPGDIVRTSIGIGVAQLDRARDFYSGLLGLTLGAATRASAAELRLNGLAEGELRHAATTIPGADAVVVFSEYRLRAGAAEKPEPFRWRLQDVGSPQFQLAVVGLDALLERTQRAGYGFLSVGGKPIQRPFGRFVFAIDGDGVLVEYVEAAQ
jgi:catechol 2,3-dioxygenase-like lactoylglutathione lyase family enzyme